MKLLIKELLPSPDPSVHASTLAVLPDGTVTAAWFGGTKESAPDVRIRVSRRINGAWTAPFAIEGNEGLPHWNPVLFADGNLLHLFYKVGNTIPAWRTWHTISADGGQTFAAPAPLSSPCPHGGPVKNKPIVLSDGRILAPGSTETKDGRWFCFAESSADHGTTWEHRDIDAQPLADGSAPQLIQPSFWESAPGKVHALCRSAHGCLYRFDSLPDGGFTPAYPTEIPNNNSGIDLVRLPDGRLFLVSNPVSGNWASRAHLTLSLSHDNGQTFSTALTLEKEASGEFSYPAVVTSGGKLYLTYTYNRKQIAFLVIDPDSDASGK